MEEIIYNLLMKIETSEEPIEDLLIKEARNYGLNDNDIKEILEVFSNLDSINNKAIELEKAKKEGSTTGSWISGQLEKITPDDDESSEKFLNVIQESIERNIEKIDDTEN